MRNLCTKLRDITRNSKCGPCYQRKELGRNTLRIRKAVISAIHYRKSKPSTEAEKKLRHDILNVPYHVFGDHKKCDSYFCKKGSADVNFVEEFTSSGLMTKIMEAINLLADNSRSLLFNVSNNAAEGVNSKISKFVGGKRINYCLKNSYQTRCKAAAVSYNAKTPKTHLVKVLRGSSPGINIKKYEQKIRRRNEVRKFQRKPRKLFTDQHPERKSYGPQAQRPDLPPDLLEIKKKERCSKK